MRFLVPTITERPSLAAACAALGVELNRSGEGCCPLHDDKNPSFGIFVSDSGIERYKCHGCTATGDVYDLVQRKLDIDFLAAKTWLADMPPAPERTPADVPPSWDASYWYDELQKHEVYTSEQRRKLAALTGFDPWYVQSPFVCDWHLNGDEVWMPYWQCRAHADDRLTGIKIRGTQSRWSAPGSTFSCLHGSWWFKPNGQYQTVLVCEGDTDRVWAAAIVQHFNLPVTVCSVPSASWIPRDCTWETLRGRRVHVAFDNDMAGRCGAERFITAARAAGIEATPFKFGAPGQDLREAKPDLSDLTRTTIPRRSRLPERETCMKEQREGASR